MVGVHQVFGVHARAIEDLVALRGGQRGQHQYRVGPSPDTVQKTLNLYRNRVEIIPAP
jgi:hypothetical protein